MTVLFLTRHLNRVRVVGSYWDILQSVTPGTTRTVFRSHFFVVYWHTHFLLKGDYRSCSHMSSTSC